MSTAVAIDVTTGAAFGGGASLDAELHRWNATVARRRAQVRRLINSGQRADSLGDHPRVRDNVVRLDSWLKQNENRLDGFDASTGVATARELEHVYAEVMRETYPATNALSRFAIDTSVPAGARTHTVSRFYEAGTAAVYRKGEPIPTVGLSKAEESFPVRHYVTSFVLDLFEMLSLGMINVQGAAEHARIARDVVGRFANKMTWEGSAAHGIYGILNYPWLTTYVESAAFNRSASPTDLLNALHRAANYPSDTYKDAVAPEVMAMGHRLYNLISTTRMAADMSQTVLQAFLEESPYIREVWSANELTAAGPAGADGILCYRADRLGISNVIVSPFSSLPLQEDGFDRRQIFYMSHGGVIMREVLNNVLVWVEGPAGLTS